MQCLFHTPHRSAAMFSETIEPAQFSQSAQFAFRERDAPFEIVQRLEAEMFSFSLDFFAVFLAQPVYDAKSQTHRIVIDDCAAPIGLLDTNRQNFYTVPLRIF